MSEGSGSKVGDLLGIQPIAKSVEAVTTRSLDAVASLWTALLKPAAEEVGLLLQDRVRVYRQRNLAAVTEKASVKFQEIGVNPNDVTLPPRLGIVILNQSSLAEDEVLREMWAGLLVSSATRDGTDESNLMFTDLLAKLTGAQARLLEYACTQVQKGKTASGLVVPINRLQASLDQTLEIAKLDDIYRLDRELDYLRTLGLLEEGSGLPWRSEGEAPLHVDLTPTALALQMSMRCHGGMNPIDFFKLADASPVTAVMYGARTYR